MEGTAFTTTENTISVYYSGFLLICILVLIHIANCYWKLSPNYLWVSQIQCILPFLTAQAPFSVPFSQVTAPPATQWPSQEHRLHLWPLSFSPAFITKSDCLYILKVPHIHSPLSIFTSSLTLPLLHCLTTEQCIRRGIIQFAEWMSIHYRQKQTFEDKLWIPSCYIS